MANGTIALEQISEQYRSTIARIESTPAGSCPAHGALAKGVTLMMQWHLIQMSQEMDSRRALREAVLRAAAASLLGGGAAGGILGAVVAKFLLT